MKTTIVLTGGGTAGHISPTLSVAAKIKELRPSVELVYIIERNNPNEHLITELMPSIKVRRIFAGKFRRYPTQNWVQKLFSFKNNLLNLRDMLYVLIGLFQAFFILLFLRPKVIFSKGGFVSVPVCLSATLLRRKFITHDSDSIPGLANRIVARYAVKNAVGVFGASYPYHKDRIVYTGVPVREEFYKMAGVSSEQAKKDIGLPDKCQLIFVGGGSQGAKQLDDAFEKIAESLLSKFPNLYIIHQFGRLNEGSLTSRYHSLEKTLRPRLLLKTFLSDIEKYLAAADIVVGRAGATAMAEYSVLSKACVIVPAAHLSGGHQLVNAKLLEDQGAIISIPQDRVGEQLENELMSLLQHPNKIAILGTKLNQITPFKASDKIAQLVVDQLL